MHDEQHGRAAAPVSGAPSGATGRRSVRTGTEPATARSAVGMRLVLSAIFLPLFVAATVGLAIWAGRQRPGDSPGGGP